MLDWKASDTDVWIYRVYGPGVDQAQAEWRRFGDHPTYLHHDALGSVTAASDANGLYAYRSYKAFGATTSTRYDTPSIATSRLGYTGREISTGSLMNYRNRYYDLGSGRFAQQDTYAGDELSGVQVKRTPSANSLKKLPRDGRELPREIKSHLPDRHVLISGRRQSPLVLEGM